MFFLVFSYIYIYNKNKKTMNKEQIMGVIRHTLTFVGGILLIKGLGSESLFTEISGLVMGLVGAIWSIFDKKD